MERRVRSTPRSDFRIVHLAVGDVFPAEIRLKGNRPKTDEPSPTGKSKPAEKIGYCQETRSNRNVGNADKLCTNESGTLTQNEIEAQEVADPEDHSCPELINYALPCNMAVVEGIKNQAILDAMHRSAATNEEVKVDWNF